MITEKTLMKFGLTKDESNFQLKEVFKNNLKLKEIHIDVYPDNPLIASSAPFMLLLRMIENNVIVSNDEDRIILKKNDKYKTYLANILLSEITDCCYKTSNELYEFIFKVRNTYYRVNILN